MKFFACKFWGETGGNARTVAVEISFRLIIRNSAVIGVRIARRT
jgi:hypothetical protein